MTKKTQWKCPKCLQVIDTLRVDGYAFGDRLLEGVMFDVQKINGKWKATVEPLAVPYFSQLNEKMWLKRAAEFAQDSEDDIMQCSACSYDIVAVDDEI